MNSVINIGSDCSHCGACSVVCPKKCIGYNYSETDGDFSVEVDSSACINCGLCTKVCPVYNTNMSIMPFKEECMSAQVYASHSKDEQIRKAAASGGFITSLLCYLLEQGLIDGALISKRTKAEGVSFIAQTKEEILSAKTSIYAPVNYAKGLQELKDTACKKVAVVGLPCHINSVNEWRKINKSIDNKIFLTISIVCGKTPTLGAYQFIAEKNKFSYEGIQTVNNRGEGWPGFMTIVHKEGVYKVPYRDNMSMGMVLSSSVFSRSGCLSCLDGYGRTADLSVCDAWLPQYTSPKSNGWNLVLAQTKVAKELLNSDSIASYLYLVESDLESFYKANRRVIDKHLLNYCFRKKKFRPDWKVKKGLKKSLYVGLLNILQNSIKSKNKSKLGMSYLWMSKIINKLKD